MADEGGLKFAEITREIIGAAMEVHRHLGNGFQEVIYQRCLAIELKNRGIEFLREQEMPLFYKSHEVGSRRVDFVVRGKILVELKALSSVSDVERAQVLNYLTAYRMEIGLLLNYGTPSLQFERFINSKFSKKSASSYNPVHPRF
jgi:GxxExxY protein